MTRYLPRSLAGQFALLHVLTALVAAATLPFGVAVLLHHVADHYQRQVLEQQADVIAAALRTSPPQQALAVVDILSGGLTLTVVDGGRHVLAERGPSRQQIVATAPLGIIAKITRHDAVAAFTRPMHGRWVIVSQDASAPEVVTDDIVQTFLKRFVLLLIPLAMLVPVMGALLTRRMIARMTAVSQIAAAIGPRTLDRRLPLGTLPSEVEPLAHATNAALDRLEQAFKAQAAFAADVAHELRTPLAVVRLRADAVADPETRRAMLSSVDRAARVIGQLLGLADLERPIDGASERVDLAALAAAVVSERAPGIFGAGRAIALEDRGGAVRGFSGSIQLALENLIDNAARHTPGGTQIIVVAGPGAQVTVTDDGPPIAADRLHRMTTRFWRAGDDPHTGGSGLGLSIVERVALAHGGMLHLRAGRDGRGLEAILCLAPLRPGGASTEQDRHPLLP